MDWAPYARITARYIIGTVFGAATSDVILNDPDLMNVLTMSISAGAAYAVERVYAYAKSRGWAT